MKKGCLGLLISLIFIYGTLEAQEIIQEEKYGRPAWMSDLNYYLAQYGIDWRGIFDVDQSQDEGLAIQGARKKVIETIKQTFGLSEEDKGFNRIFIFEMKGWKCAKYKSANQKAPDKIFYKASVLARWNTNELEKLKAEIDRLKIEHQKELKKKQDELDKVQKEKEALIKQIQEAEKQKEVEELKKLMAKKDEEYKKALEEMKKFANASTGIKIENLPADGEFELKINGISYGGAKDGDAFWGLEAGKQKIEVIDKKRRYAPYEAEVNMIAGKLINHRALLSPIGETVVINVSPAIASAEIYINGKKHPRIIINGIAEIYLKPGNYDLMVKAPGYQTNYSKVEIHKGNNLIPIVLEPPIAMEIGMIKWEQDKGETRAINVVRLDPFSSEKLTPQTEEAGILRAGQRFKFLINLNQKAYLYLINYSIYKNKAETQSLFPHPELVYDRNPISAGKFKLPSGGYAYEPDKNVGLEYVIAIAAKDPIDEKIEEIKRELGTRMLSSDQIYDTVNRTLGLFSTTTSIGSIATEAYNGVESSAELEKAFGDRVAYTIQQYRHIY